TNAGVVAFKLEDGKTLWQALDDKASASSPVLAEIGGKLRLLVATRSALHSMDPETGSNLWQIPTRKQTSGNVYCASPIVFSNYVLLSGWYNLGALLLKLNGDSPPEKVWHLDDAISTHYANIIPYEGSLY